MRVPVLLLLALTFQATAQDRFTLAKAVAVAFKNNPRLALERVNRELAGEAVTSARASLFPVIAAHTTAAGANDSTRLAARALNNPIIFNRYAFGTSMTQLITDFGRTAELVEGSRTRQKSQRETREVVRAELVLAVHRAYYTSLQTRGALAIQERVVGLRATGAALIEAKLAAAEARNEHQTALADLAALLGYTQPPAPFDLEDIATPAGDPPLAADATALVAAAMAARPELAALRLEREAAVRLAQAERKLTLPTVTAFANAGVAPVQDDRLKSHWAAAAINLSVPVFNGHLFSARRRDAELRVEAIDQRLRKLEVSITREVTVAAAAVRTAWERLTLTGELHAASTESESHAIELQELAARYDYLLQRSVLDFQTGRLR